MIVFPEAMNELDSENSTASIETIEGYIDYMRQRIEWAMRNVTKSVSSGNTSSAEMYILLVSLQNTVAALQSTVNSHGASISSMLQTLTILQNDLTALAARVATLETNYTALDERVTALEQEANTDGNE